jgi:hypothetical protein
VLLLDNVIWRAAAPREPDSPHREGTSIGEPGRHLIGLTIGFAEGTVQNSFSGVYPLLDFWVVTSKYSYVFTMLEPLSQQFNGLVW